jgi:hypothetical protein
MLLVSGKCDLEERSIISPIFLQINRIENRKKNSSLGAYLKSAKPVKVPIHLDLEVSFFVKIFEFYHVTQSLQGD